MIIQFEEAIVEKENPEGRKNTLASTAKAGETHTRNPEVRRHNKSSVFFGLLIKQVLMGLVRHRVCP
jgi:hypothetical protein